MLIFAFLPVIFLPGFQLMQQSVRQPVLYLP